MFFLHFLKKKKHRILHVLFIAQQLKAVPAPVALTMDRFNE